MHNVLTYHLKLDFITDMIVVLTGLTLVNFDDLLIVTVDGKKRRFNLNIPNGKTPATLFTATILNENLTLS